MQNKVWLCVMATAAGTAGGLLLTAGHFYPSLSILQTAAFLPFLSLVSNQRNIFIVMLSGIFMGLAFTIPQMIVLRMNIGLTAALLAELTMLLTILCIWGGWCMRKATLWGCFAFGAGWMLLDWLNYTAIPIWGMAQSFARCWTAWPHLIAFIQFTGISGVLFAAGSIQALFVQLCHSRQNRTITLALMGAVIIAVLAMDLMLLREKPTGMIRVAAAGWTSRDSLGGFHNHDQKEAWFNSLYAEPAAKAASDGAKIFVSGEKAFNIYENERSEWVNKFSLVARKNHLYLVVGYAGDQGNRLFFMNPQGDIIAEYTKTYLSPPEWGNEHGNGDLQTIEISGINVGAMICQDDNFSRLTRYYGRYKTPLVMIPTWDWEEVKDAHFSAVRARAIECRFGIARSAHHGIAAIISPDGNILAKHDTFLEWPDYVIADVPLYEGITLFARVGHIPMMVVSAGVIIVFLSQMFGKVDSTHKCN